MKEFAINRLAFAAIFTVLLSFSVDNYAQDASSSEEAGARMEVEIKGVTTAFRWAPPGKFTRQWNKSTERNWEKRTSWDDDKEDYEITLTKGFWLAETETTQELWYAVMGRNPSSGGKTKKKPVNNVSWDDVQEFILKLNEAGYAPDGYEFRLPTEAQWEYACMAGTTEERYGELDAIAWYSGNSNNRGHEVGTKQANAWGLCDMLGNVWEWCEDRRAPYPMRNLTDYSGPSDGSYRVVRGGGWYNETEICSRSYRRKYDWRLKLDNLGFRLSLISKEG